MRKLRVSEDIYNGARTDRYAECIRSIRHTLDDSLFIEHQGMWGGYYAVREALPLLRSILLAATRTVVSPGQAERSATIHVRLGDFEKAASGPGPGEFNKAIPIAWYEGVVRSLTESFGADLKIRVVTNDVAACRNSQVLSPHMSSAGTLRLDLAALLTADLLVSSVSSLSMFAAASSNIPYIWYQPNLNSHAEFGSLWGHEDRQVEGVTARNVAAEETNPRGQVPRTIRGIPVPANGELVEGMLRPIRDYFQLTRSSSDLVFYGVQRRTT